jgi:penicillin G amidase
MKILRRLLFIIAGFLLICGIILFIFLQYQKPKYNGELKISGLISPVEVHFDEIGVPHIYAQNEEDAYLALGYVHASERLFQMEIIRRIGSGRLAEILGPELTEVDRFFRTLGIGEISKHLAQKHLSSDTLPYQKASLSYIKGINTFIEQGRTPLEFTMLMIPKAPFTTEDVFNIGGFMGFSFSEIFKTDPALTFIKQNFGEEYLNSLALHYEQVIRENSESEIAPQMVGDYFKKINNKLPVKLWIGSNGWVLAPHKTSSGKAFLVNDTHIGYSQPATFYEAHLEYPGQSFYGNFLAGFPFALTGHNPYSGWGLTMFQNDDADLFAEKIHPDDSSKIMYKGAWTDIKFRPETLKVRGAPDFIFDVRITPHGPVISDASQEINHHFNDVVSFYWTFSETSGRSIETFYQLSHAKEISAARQAASFIDAPGLNILFADHHGNIAKWPSAKLVKRPEHVNSKLFLDGASGNDEYLGYYDFTDHPHIENPESGFIASANEQAGKINGKYYPGYYAPDERALRIKEFLALDKRYSIQDMKQLLMQDSTGMHYRIKNIFLEILKEKPASFSESETNALEILQEWSGLHNIDNKGPVVYYKLLAFMLKNSMKDELGEKLFETFPETHTMKNSLEKFLLSKDSPWWDNIHTPKKETRYEIVLASFKEAVRDIETLFGNLEKARWQDIHTLEHVHPIGRRKPFDKIFNVGPYGVPGGIESINNSRFPMFADQKFKTISGPAMRRIIDFSDPLNSESILPTGQSGNIMSKHYSNQAEMYNTGQFRKQKMVKEEILENKTGTLRLLPAK